MIHPEMVT